MKSFRVKDARFRILKGGKIGLSLSISLIGSTLIFGSINSFATDYFTDVDAGLSTNNYSQGSISLDLQTAANNGTTIATRTETTSDSVVFKPTSWANSYYTGATYTSDYYGNSTGTEAFSLLNTTENLLLNLTFSSGANANDIYKDNTTIYNTDSTSAIFTSTTKNLVSTSSTNYTANLIFSGNNTVSGYTDIDNGNIAINGTATFSGTVQASSIDINTTNTITFNSAVDLSPTSTTYNYDLKFNSAGNIILNSDLTGNVTVTANNQGTITTTGLNQTITGNIGTSVSNDLGVLNIGSSTNSTNYSNTTINGNVFANSTVLNNNGSTNSSTLILTAGSNITSNITTTDANMGILTLQGSSNVDGTVGTNSERLNSINSGANGSSSTFTGDIYSVNISNTGTGSTTFQNDVNATNVNVNAGTTTFEDNLTATTTTITTGTGNFNTVSGTTNSNIVFTNSGTSNLYGNLTGNITTSINNQGIVSLIGDNSGKSQTIIGNVGSSGLSIATLNVGESGSSSNYSTTTINGDVFAISTVLNNGTINSSTLILSSGKSITSTITTVDDGKGILTLSGGTQNVNGSVGSNSAKLAEINAGANGSSSTFSSDVYATNLDVEGTGSVNLNGNYTGTTLRYNADGIVNLADNKNITSDVTTATNNTGTLNVNGTSTISGSVGTNSNRLKEINAGLTGEIATFENSVFATTTNLGSGIINFNTNSGDTTSNIIFSGTGTANLNGNLNGNLNFAGNDATVNIADGKGILGSVETLANNTGILNFSGDSEVSDVIGSVLYGIKELNINTNDEQDKDSSGTVTSNGLLARKEIFADIINLYNNATLTLDDNANITNTGLDNLVLSTNSANTGNLVFKGNSVVNGEIGTNSNNLESITAGVSGKTVTFNDMVYASSLKYIDNGTVILNGENNSNIEGFIGIVDLNSKTGTLEIGDNVDLTTGISGIQFENANTSTLTFNGSSTIYGVLGGDTSGNSTFESIYAGVTGETVTFKNDVYVKESTFHVSEDGVVNFEGDLYGDLIFENDGIVNVTNTKSIIVSSTPIAITTANDGKGTVNFEGTTTLYTDIGESALKLNNIYFASSGTSTNVYNQDIAYNIYSNNTIIGNDSNKTNVNIKDDLTFGGNVVVNDNSTLNVSNYDVSITNNLNVGKNSTLSFKVYTTDLSAGQAVENGASGSINATSLTIDSTSKINIDYEGSWEGAGQYNLITTSNYLISNYYGTEDNGLVTDNSIIDSIVKINGANLTLYADRTSGGSFNPEDLYIEKSEIGEDYSNGASQALAGYANDANRAGALADIIRDIEEYNGGTILSEEKKQEMIKTQRLLAPTANSSNMQTAITATNLATTTIKGRLSDIRTTETNNFTPNIYRTLGMSSGNYYSFDTSFWVKAMGGKATQDRVKDYNGYDTTTYGFVGGMDKISTDGTIFGAAVAYSTTKTNQDNDYSDSSDTKSIQGTIYSSLAYENAYVDSYLSYAKHQTEGTRTANSGKLTSTVDSDQIMAKVETGYSIPINDGVSVTPFTSLEYSLLNQKGYTEKGTTYQNDALKVDSLKLNRGTVEIGAKITSNVELEDALIIPQLSISAYNSFGDNSTDIKAQFVGGGKEFVTPVSELNKTMYNVGLGVETKISDSTSLIFDVDYDRSKDGNFQGYSGSVTFGLSF